MLNCLSLCFQIFKPTNNIIIINQLCTFCYLNISAPCFLISSYDFSHFHVIEMNIEESYRRLIAQKLKINQLAQYNCR